MSTATAHERRIVQSTAANVRAMIAHGMPSRTVRRGDRVVTLVQLHPDVRRRPKWAGVSEIWACLDDNG